MIPNQAGSLVPQGSLHLSEGMWKDGGVADFKKQNKTKKTPQNISRIHETVSSCQSSLAGDAETLASGYWPFWGELASCRIE